MKFVFRVALLTLVGLAPASAGSLLDVSIPAVTPGSEGFDISRVATYHGRWRQFDRASGTPLNGYVESLFPVTVDGSALLEHRMVIDLPTGGQVINRSLHDPASFAPVRIIREFIDGPPERPDKQVVEFTDFGYTVSIHGPADHSREVRVPASVKGFSGANLGLAIAGLPLASGYQARLPSVMPQFQGSYWALISVSGETRFDLNNGSTVDAWLVNVDWLHVESGDVYPGGAEGSGGRYTIAKQIEAGQPRVLRYLTDTSDVRLVSVEAFPPADTR